ncbi:MAG: hypothetical protein PVG39_12205 [Desulfobacteraceae bacterium]|jgi:hypothetical protein
MKKAISLVFMVLLTGTLLTGCMISHRSHTSETSSGYPISKSQLDSVEPGVTTKDWVLDNFGEPDRERHLKNGEEILVYENTKHKSSHVSFFLLFSSHTSENIKETVSFKIKDGIVTSYSVN